MKFGPVSLEQAEGKILAHNISGPERGTSFRKGKPLQAADIAALQNLGYQRVYVAELEPGDVEEDAAALRVAQVLCGGNLSITRPHVGRVNLQAQEMGILRIDVGRLGRLNEIEGITVATLPNHSVAQLRQTVATVKIIPFAVPENRLQSADSFGSESGPVIELQPLRPRRVILVLSGPVDSGRRVGETFGAPLRTRIEALGSHVVGTEFVSAEEEDWGNEALVRALRRAVELGAELIVFAGETAVMDSHDRLPLAIEELGGRITCFGAPVDPGNLLLIAYLDEVPVLGAPGCARSLKPNVIDWVLPRLLVSERLVRADIIALGHGGLLEGQPELPYSASNLSVAAREPVDRAV